MRNKTANQKKADELLTLRQQNLPEWIRPPMRGPEHFTGLTRAKLYELAGKKKIRTVSIREPGQLRGCRLFHLKSILDFLNQCEQEFNETTPQAA